MFFRVKHSPAIKTNERKNIRKAFCTQRETVNNPRHIPWNKMQEKVLGSQLVAKRYLLEHAYHLVSQETRIQMKIFLHLGKIYCLFTITAHDAEPRWYDVNHSPVRIGRPAGSKGLLCCSLYMVMQWRRGMNDAGGLCALSSSTFAWSVEHSKARVTMKELSSVQYLIIQHNEQTVYRDRKV